MKLVVLLLWVGLVLTGGGRAAVGASSVALSYQVHDPRWSPSGKQLAYIVTHGEIDNGFANPRWRARIWLVDANGRNARALTPRQFAVQDLAWSPDGSALAYRAGGHLWRYDLKGSLLTQLTYGRYDDAWWPVWSPDGETIAYTQGHRFTEGIFVIPARGGTPRRVMDTHERPEWSPDGTRLLVQPDPAFVNLDGSGFTGAGVDGCDPRGWSADGKYLFGALCVWDITTERKVSGWSTTVALSPQSATLSFDDTTFAVTGGFNGRVFLVSRSGRVQRLPGGDSSSEGATWSRKGEVAYIAQGVCGRHSEIRVSNERGGHVRTTARACSLR